MTMFELVEAYDLVSQAKLWIWTIVGVPANLIWEDEMEPVVGLDVSKGSSVAQAFVKRNEPYGRQVKIMHTESGFKRLEELLGELRERTSEVPVVILEATGHYHRGLVAFLVRSGIKHFIVNPLQSKRARSTHLRKVKTDATDASHLADMYYRGQIQPHRTWEEQYAELQHLTRQHEFITSLYVQAKLNTRALVDQVFPEFEGVFSDLFSKTALEVLRQCLLGHLDGIDQTIKTGSGKSHAAVWIQEKTERLNRALDLWPEALRRSSQAKALEAMIGLLKSFQEQIGRLEEQIEEIAVVLPQVDWIKSIPGVGDKLAAAIVAEIGDAKQFKDAKQLVAYAGLDPGVHSSGKFTSTKNPISKRGSKRLRRAVFLAVQCGIRRGSNNKLRDYYDKKRQEGKPYKVAMIACANKLLHHIHAILRKGEPYQI